jgi:hypothetical protein
MMEGPNTAIGWLHFDPEGKTTEKKPWWCILKCDWSWYTLYEHWIDRHGLGRRWVRAVDPLRTVPVANGLGAPRYVQDPTPRIALTGGVHPPAWGPHISVVRGEMPRNKALWGQYEGTQIRFRYDPNDVRRNDEYIWLPVECPALLDFREELGLRREPRQALHLTVAHWK